MGNIYKKHEFEGIITNIPVQIYECYCNKFNYHYITIKDFGEIPISFWGYQGIKEVANIKDDDKRIDTRAWAFSDENYWYIPNIAELCNLDLTNYAKGFLDGYNSDFNTFLGTPESKIENIINTISCIRGLQVTDITRCAKPTPNGLRGCYDIDVRCGECIRILGLTELYNDGLREGKQYKAWEYIIQTPNIFIQNGYFKEELTTQTTQPTYRKIQ